MKDARVTDKTAYPLSGVVPIIHTPWTEDDRIDFPSLERLIERSIEDGVSGCIMPAVASEVSTHISHINPAGRTVISNRTA